VNTTNIIEQSNPITGGKDGYSDYINKITPTHALVPALVRAFLVGGMFCVFGQAILSLLQSNGIDEKSAGTWCSIILVFLAALFTGFGLYAKLAKFAGAGSLVPITGFANSVAAPAIEYKKEGVVFGIGVKIFTIAGPVIAYGIFFSWLLGIVYLLML